MLPSSSSSSIGALSSTAASIPRLQKQHSDQMEQLPFMSTTTNAASAATANHSSFLLHPATAMTISRGSDDQDNDKNDDDDNNTGNEDNSDTEALPAKRGMRQRRSSSQSLEILAQMVQWIQRWKIPRSWFLLQRKNTTTTTATTTANTSTNAPEQEWVSLISGVDRVVFGTASASEAVLLCGLKPPQYLWYMLSGGICDVIQFAMDVALHYTLGIEDASLCWALGFGLSIVFRHTSHRYLVFGDYVGGYQKSLIRMYGGYSIIIVISTIFNLIMTRLAKISHYAAWIITLLWTGIVNYFILKKIWSFGGKTTTTTTTSASVALSSSRGRTFSSGSTSGTTNIINAIATPVRGRTFSTGSTASMTTPRERTFSSSANLVDSTSCAKQV